MEINGIAHIVLTVSDFAAARRFYGALLPALGLVPLIDADGYYYCIGGRTGVAIRPSEDPDAGRFSQERPGLHHFCFRARDRAHVDAIHALAVELGAKVHRAPEEGPFAPGYYSTLFEDPDGMRIEMNHIPGKGHLEAK
ncbi:MAG: VOC family protein [Myxococcales bacterium]|nr:VOC family protein [Myxococcales bacterium]